MTNLLFLEHKTLVNTALDEAFPPIKNNAIARMEIIHANYGGIHLRKWYLLQYFHEDRISPTFGKGLWLDVSCHPMQDADAAGTFTLSFQDSDKEHHSEIVEHARLEYDFSNDCIELTIRITTPDGMEKVIDVPYPEGKIRMDTSAGM